MKYGCFGCHSPTIRVIGPAYREIAAARGLAIVELADLPAECFVDGIHLTQEGNQWVAQRFAGLPHWPFRPRYGSIGSGFEATPLTTRAKSWPHGTVAGRCPHPRRWTETRTRYVPGPGLSSTGFW